MIIPINDMYRISSDPRQWRVDKRKKEKDHYIWVSISFFPRFEHAVASLGDRLARESEAVGIVECTEEVKRIATLLSLALPSEYKLVAVEHHVETIDATTETG